MLERDVLRSLTVATVFAGLIGSISCSQRESSAKPKTTDSQGDKQQAAEGEAPFEPSLPRLPETQLPAGLPIVPWGKRDHFPVIRKPEYLTAQQGDRALAPDEPVLGLVIREEVRAYSTNQLNEHEMVIDTIAGTPVLVTY
jgi:hypothetical protein